MTFVMPCTSDVLTHPHRYLLFSDYYAHYGYLCPFLCHSEEMFTHALLMLLRSTGIIIITPVCSVMLGSFCCTISCRFFKHEARHLTYLSGDLDPGNVCPLVQGYKNSSCENAVLFLLL